MFISTLINRLICKIFGHTDEELLGRGDLFDFKTKEKIGFAIFFYCERCFKGRIQEHYFDTDRNAD